MTVQLDPFHLIRGINCEEPDEEATDHGFVGLSDSFFSDYQLNNSCGNADFGVNCPGPKTPFGAGYRTQFAIRLSAPLITCAQAIFSVIGRDSGASEILDIAGFYNNLGWDCFNPECVFCSHQIGNRAHFLDDSAVGVWSPSLIPPTNQISIDLFTKTAIGFTSAERLDIVLPTAPKISITSILDRVAGGVWVTVPGDLQPDQSMIRVVGTVNYDGDYRINDPAAGRFWIDIPYVADEFTGTVQAKYDGPVFI